MKGVYACKVGGQLPDEIQLSMEEVGIRYIPYVFPLWLGYDVGKKLMGGYRRDGRETEAD